MDMLAEIRRTPPPHIHRAPHRDPTARTPVPAVAHPAPGLPSPEVHPALESSADPRHHRRSSHRRRTTAQPSPPPLNPQPRPLPSPGSLRQRPRQRPRRHGRLPRRRLHRRHPQSRLAAQQHASGKGPHRRTERRRRDRHRIPQGRRHPRPCRHHPRAPFRSRTRSSPLRDAPDAWGPYHRFPSKLAAIALLIKMLGWQTPIKIEVEHDPDAGFKAIKEWIRNRS